MNDDEKTLGELEDEGADIRLPPSWRAAMEEVQADARRASAAVLPSLNREPFTVSMPEIDYEAIGRAQRERQEQEEADRRAEKKRQLLGLWLAGAAVFISVLLWGIDKFVD